MTNYVDTFNRASLGATGPNGAPWQGTVSGWTIVGDQLTTTGAADNQLVLDAGATDVTLSVTIGANNNSNDVGLIARWVDASTYVALSVRPDVQQIILYNRAGGFGVIASWSGVTAIADPTGKTLTLEIVGNDFTAKVDGVTIGTAAWGSNPTVTNVGIWSYNATVPFDDFTINDGAVVVPELAAGHLAVGGAGLGAPSDPDAPTLTAGHLTLARPVGGFTPVQPYEPTVFDDNFERDTVNPTADGYNYRGADQWQMRDDNSVEPQEGLAPGALAMLLVYRAGGPIVSASVSRTDANMSVFNRAQRGGLILGHTNDQNYVTVTIEALLGVTILAVIEYHDGAPIDHGGFPLGDTHVGTIGADLAGTDLTVSWNGVEQGLITLNYTHMGAVGLVALRAAGDSIQPPQFDALHIEWPPPPGTTPMVLALALGELHAPGYMPLGGAMGGADRGPVAYGPRISQPGTIIPPIVAKVFRLRNPDTPVVTLDQSFARTWQEQMGEAGSGSVTVMNDDPDLALIRDGDVIRFELYGEAAFSFVVTEREQTTIASGEEHDQVTVLSGPGLLSWLTSSVLIYPARQPQPLINGPVPDRYIQGEPVETDRVFSWASYANLVDLDLYGPTYSQGPMTDPLPEDWPEGIYVERIWSGDPDRVGDLYFRFGFTTHEPQCEIYIAGPPNDPLKAWLDGSLMVESDGSLDAGAVQTIGGQLSDLGTDNHVLTIKVDHQGGAAGLTVLGLGINDDGEFTGLVCSTSTDWLAIPYPAFPPPVTAGAVLLAVLGEINSRRYNPQLGATFTEEFDSSGNRWPALPEISTKVGTTLWAFLQEMSDYVEFHMYHDPRLLYAWDAGKRGDERDVTLHGPTDPHDPMTANLSGLTHKRVT